MSGHRVGNPRESVPFRIDVEAEIRKISKARLKTEGQYVVDLVSQLLDLGARSIHLNRRRNALEIKCPGSESQLNATLFPALLVILNPKAAPAKRHQALLLLERRAGHGLLSPFARQKYHTSIEWTDGNENICYIFKTGQPPRITRPRGYRGILIHLRMSKNASKEQLAYAREHCEYAPTPIYLNRKKINRPLSLDDCFMQTLVKETDLYGIIGIPQRGELIQLTELRRGIVVRKTVHPPLRGLVFSAVFEGAGFSDHDLTRKILPHGARLYRQLAQKFATLDDRAQRRAQSLLLKRCLATGKDDLLVGLKAFSQANGPRLEFREIVDLAKCGPIYALDRKADVNEYSTQKLTVLLLDRRHRESLEQLGGLELRPPPRKVSWGRIRPGFFFNTQKFFKKKIFKNLSLSFLSRLGEEIPETDLSRPEHNFLKAVERAHNSDLFDLLPSSREWRVFMTEDQKLPVVFSQNHRTKTLQIGICRSHGAVKKMVEAFHTDPETLYASLTYLTEYHPEPR